MGHLFQRRRQVDTRCRALPQRVVRLRRRGLPQTLHQRRRGSIVEAGTKTLLEAHLARTRDGSRRHLVVVLRPLVFGHGEWLEASPKTAATATPRAAACVGRLVP